MPEPMIAYRQVNGSSWNMRSELQKAYVTLQIYHEAKRVLPMFGFANFVKCNRAFKTLFLSRKETDGYFELDEKIVRDTKRYSSSGFLFKLYYCIRWFFPAHCLTFARIKVTMDKLLRRRADIKC